MQKIILILFAITIFGCTQAQDKNDIKRIVSQLASDKMEGRSAGTKGEEMAAEFIASEFQKAGLQYFGNLKTYSQGLKTFSNDITIQSLVVNGKASKNAFAIIDSPSLEIKNLQDFPIEKVSSNEDFRERFKNILDQKNKAVVLVAKSHSQLFEKYKSYFSRPQTALDLGGQPQQLLFVLENEPTKSLQASIKNDREEVEMQNVVGVLEGKSKKDEYVIISAHYDHIGVQKKAVNGDNIANGADDDASGTTAVIALAQHYAKQKNNARTLIFVAFTAEEIGGYGSQFFSKNIDPDKVVAMINLEMIGKESKFGRKAAFITGFEMSDLGKILQKNTQGKGFSFHPDPYPSQNLFYRSDNATLAKLGVPAHTLSTVQIDKDEYYHTVDDEVETLDIENMTEVIKILPVAIESIVNGKDTPSRLPKKQD